MTNRPERPSWEPFALATPGDRADLPRSLGTREGVADRLRTAAFAEIQAREAFLWAASRFTDAEPALQAAWLELSRQEDKHLNWLLQRMLELDLDVRDRKVSDHLWVSLTSCSSAREFALFMANAEERGRKAGVRFYEALRTTDLITAQIFGKIAEEEVSHIALAQQFFTVLSDEAASSRALD